MLRQTLKKINNLVLSIDSLNLATEEKGTMMDRIKLDLNSSELHVSRHFQEIRDHQDTINSLMQQLNLKTVSQQAVFLSVTRLLV